MKIAKLKVAIALLLITGSTTSAVNYKSNPPAHGLESRAGTTVSASPTNNNAASVKLPRVIPIRNGRITIQANNKFRGQLNVFSVLFLTIKTKEHSLVSQAIWAKEPTEDSGIRKIMAGHQLVNTEITVDKENRVIRVHPTTHPQGFRKWVSHQLPYQSGSLEKQLHSTQQPEILGIYPSNELKQEIEKQLREQIRDARLQRGSPQSLLLKKEAQSPHPYPEQQLDPVTESQRHTESQWHTESRLNDYPSTTAQWSKDGEAVVYKNTRSAGYKPPRDGYGTPISVQHRPQHSPSLHKSPPPNGYVSDGRKSYTNPLSPRLESVGDIVGELLKIPMQIMEWFGISDHGIDPFKTPPQSPKTPKPPTGDEETNPTWDFFTLPFRFVFRTGKYVTDSMGITWVFQIPIFMLRSIPVLIPPYACALAPDIPILLKAALFAVSFIADGVVRTTIQGIQSNRIFTFANRFFGKGTPLSYFQSINSNGFLFRLTVCSTTVAAVVLIYWIWERTGMTPAAYARSLTAKSSTSSTQTATEETPTQQGIDWSKWLTVALIILLILGTIRTYRRQKPQDRWKNH